MKNIKIKETLKCFMVLFTPIIALMIIPFIPLMFFQNGVGIVLMLGLLIIAIAILFKMFATLLGAEIFIETVYYWKKDRLWYAVGKDDENADEIADKIIKKCTSFGSEKQVSKSEKELVCARYKRQHSATLDWATIEKMILVYRTEHLDEQKFNRIMASARNTVRQLKCDKSKMIFLEKEKKNAPVATAAAVIILADYIDVQIPSVVRKKRSCNEMAILPCVVDLSAKRCYFDGMKEYYMSTKPTKNRTIDLIIKMVFDGKLPLENNDSFDYEKIDPKLPEMTLYEMLKEFKDADKDIEKEIKKMGESLKNGETKRVDDSLYIKVGDKLAVYMIFEDEENPDVVEIGEDNCWSYPKRLQISKKDKAVLRGQVNAFFDNGLEVKFE